MRRRASLALGLLLPLALAVPARAHGIQSTLEPLQQAANGASRAMGGSPELQLSSAFSSGVPASDAAVRLVSPDGSQSIALGRTDAAGRLNFALPRNARPGWEVMVDAGAGHRDYLELPSSNGASHAQSNPGSSLWHGLMASSPLAGVSLLGLLVGAGWQRQRRR